MEINDGLYPNANPGAVRNGTKSFALNIMYNEDGNTLINENGFEIYKESIDKYGTLVGKIEIPTGVVLFFKNTVDTDKNNKDNIVYINQKSTDKKDIEIIVFKGNFNFSIEHPISGTYTYLDNKNIFITFTEGVDSINETRILYITEWKSKYEKYVTSSNEDNITIVTFIYENKHTEYILNLIPDVIYPTLDIDIIKGGLKCGGYQFAISLKLHDGTYSDYSILSPVYYAAPDYGEDIDVESITTKGFKLKFSKKRYL